MDQFFPFAAAGETPGARQLKGRVMSSTKRQKKTLRSQLPRISPTSIQIRRRKFHSLFLIGRFKCLTAPFTLPLEEGRQE
jgi:hypothetical protein